MSGAGYRTRRTKRMNNERFPWVALVRAYAIMIVVAGIIFAFFILR